MPKKSAQEKNKIQDFLFTKFLGSPRFLGFFLILLLFFSFYLRIEPALFGYSHFSFDQGLDQIMVKRLVVDKDITLISRYTGLEGVFMGPLYMWFMSIPFLISGGSPHFNIIFMSLVGIVSSGITYFLVRKMTDSTVAFFVTFFTAMSPAFIGASKIIISPAPLTFVIIFYLYLVWEIVANKKDKYAPVLAGLVSCFFQFEIGYAIFALPAAVTVILSYRKFSILKHKTIIFSLVAFLIPFTPQVLFDIRNNFLISKAIASLISGENTSLGSENQGMIGRLILRVGTFRQDLFSALAFGERNYYLGFLAVLALLLGGWYIYKKSNKKYQILWSINWFLILFVYIGFVFYKGPVWVWYRAGMPLLFSVAFSLSLAQLWKHFGYLFRFSIVLFLTLLAYISISPQGRIDAMSSTYDSGNVSSVKNQQSVLDTIYSDANGEPFGLYIYTPPVYTWIWDYELWWYAEPKYGYLPDPYDRMPQSGNPKLVYLLIEPYETESDMEGWRDNFNHYGEPIDSWKADGSVRVEKWQLHSQPTDADKLIKYVDIFEQQ